MGLRLRAEVFAPTGGVLRLCRETTERRARGVDWTGDAGLATVCELPYRRSQVRSQDAAAMGDEIQGVTLKVCVLRPPNLDTTQTVVVGGRAYDMTRADEDGRLAWLYLTGLASVGTCDLVSTQTTYDELGLPHREEVRVPVLAREVTHGSEGSGESLLSTLVVSVRACDYEGDRYVAMAGKRHAIDKVSGEGDWVRLSCAEGVADVGQA